MRNARLWTVMFYASLLGFASNGVAEVMPKPWETVPDDVYLQEVPRQVKTDTPVLAVAVHEGRLYVGFGKGVRVLNGEAFAECGGPAESVGRMRSIAGSLYVITDGGVHRLQGGRWQRLAEGRFSDVCGGMGKVFVAGGRSVYAVEGDALVKVPKADRAPGDIRRITTYSETLYCLVGEDLVLFDGAGFDAKNAADWGLPPWKAVRDLHAQGSRLYLATDKGLGLLRGMGYSWVRGADGLCYEDTTCLADGFAKDVWVGTSRGAIRAVKGEYHYFAGPRYLPHDRVRDIACGDRVVYIATDGGVGMIGYEPYTLEKKAAYYERWLDEWGQKRLGFTHKLEWDEKAKCWMREVSDNDGGWSAHYLAAQCFRFAATGDAKAREQAVNCFNTLKWCEEITSIRGFPARSIWAKGETGHKAMHGSGGFAAEWHDSADGKFEWKGDTSSDETDAHFYAAAIFHDLVAQGDEKRRAREHMARMATHIIDNGWTLRDVDGKPTVWGRWDPEYFASLRGAYAMGLNGLEVLTYMRATASLTGEAKFEEAYKRLLGMNYTREVIRQKIVVSPPKDCRPEQALRNAVRMDPDGANHSDDRMAFFCYYTVLKYEKDPALRSLYRRSLERSFEIERIEHIPDFNVIYGALTGNDCELEQAARHLREWPLDLVKHSFRNSHRADLRTPAGYVPYVGGTRAISPRESGPLRWSNSALSLDGGSGGREVEDPSGWIECYWMARYHGLITAPTAKDANVLTVPRRGLRLGAAPYDGPGRP